MGRHGRSTPVRRAVHRKQGPARAGLLSASAALTIGAMAIGTGVLPAPGGADDQRDVAAHEGERALDTASATPDRDRDDTASRGAERDEEPEASESPSEEPEEAAEDEEQEADAPSRSADPEPEPEPVEETPETVVESEPAPPAPSPDRPSPTSPPSSAPGSPSAPPQSEDPAQQAAARVLSIVNEERARAGCRPLANDGGLAVLAQDFSRDMAEREFFDHTDPDGHSPWDRADRAGVSNLGGENIARGQQSAESVMESWMNSEGHRANILNCDFRTLGVGVHIGPGGPWWTQNFGY